MKSPSSQARTDAKRPNGPHGTVPGEFRYWEQRRSAKAKWLRRGIRAMVGVDPILPDDVVRTYAASYYDADPVAEAFVEEIYMARGQAEGRAMVNAALRDGADSVRDAPASLRAVFDEVETDPDWVDKDEVERGARVFRRFGTHMYSLAGAITLHGYRENSVAKPLAFTGAYNGDSANRRFLETASFWIDVSEPGALWSGGRGRETAMRVRLMHVFVRKRLLAHPEWNLDAWGVPISQGDALLTLMGGSLVPGYMLRLVGYRIPADEILAMMHFWRYVGHLMGVQPRWYPETIQQAIGLMYTSEIKSIGASGEDGKQLAVSYVDSYAPMEGDRGVTRLAKMFEHGMQKGYCAYWVPPQTHVRYGLPFPGPWALSPPAQFLPRFVLETARRRSTTLDVALDRRARKSAQAWVRSRLGERTAEYQSVKSFTR